MKELRQTGEFVEEYREAHTIRYNNTGYNGKSVVDELLLCATHWNVSYRVYINYKWMVNEECSFIIRRGNVQKQRKIKNT